MKKFIKIILYNIITLFLLLIIINFIFVLFSKKIVNQKKNFNRSYMGLLDNFYHKLYSDTYFNLDENYIAVIGDSMIAGDGDAWVGNKYNYSSLHYLKKKTNKNFINFGIAGSSLPLQINNYLQDVNILKKFPFNINANPEKILIFFTEQNDVNDNLKTDFINRSYNLKRTINIYFPTITIIKKFSYNLIVKIYLKFKKTFFNELHKKQVQNFYENLEPDSLINIEEKDIILAVKIFENSLINFIEKTDIDIEIFYIPSPTTTLPIEILKKYNINIIDKKNNDMKSMLLENEIKNIAIKNDIKFHSLTSDFKNSPYVDQIYGLNDIQHFNELGYKLMGEFVVKRLN